MDGFYLADEKHKTVRGDVVEHKGVLYFRLGRAGFDGKATKEHVKGYPIHFQEFKDANPGFVLPSSFSDVEIGSPVAVPHVADATHPVAVVADPKLEAEGKADSKDEEHSGVSGRKARAK